MEACCHLSVYIYLFSSQKSKHAEQNTFSPLGHPLYEMSHDEVNRYQLFFSFSFIYMYCVCLHLGGLLLHGRKASRGPFWRPLTSSQSFPWVHECQTRYTVRVCLSGDIPWERKKAHETRRWLSPMIELEKQYRIAHSLQLKHASSIKHGPYSTTTYEVIRQFGCVQQSPRFSWAHSSENVPERIWSLTSLSWPSPFFIRHITCLFYPGLPSGPSEFFLRPLTMNGPYHVTKK